MQAYEYRRQNNLMRLRKQEERLGLTEAPPSLEFNDSMSTVDQVDQVDQGGKGRDTGRPRTSIPRLYLPSTVIPHSSPEVGKWIEF